VLGPWHSWGRRNVPRLALKPDPLIYDHLPNSSAYFSDCFSACKATQELPVTQLARHVDLFHLVITDNQRPETLSLPHGLAPPIKPTTHFSQATSLWTQKEWQPCGLVPINLSFPHVAWSLFGSTLQAGALLFEPPFSLVNVILHGQREFVTWLRNRRCQAILD
jgi:hypothetical protein